LIAGLGNPGPRYDNTRHNAGFALLDKLAFEEGGSFVSHDNALVCESDLNGSRVVLAKPQTYMNRSGRSLARLVAHYEVELKDLLVVYDDVALPLGTLRFRARGTSGGQKGIRSVLETLQTREVPRLRLGVGPADDRVGSELSDYVLSPFSRAERKQLEAVLEEAAAGVRTFVLEGIDRAMARYNSRKPPAESG